MTERIKTVTAHNPNFIATGKGGFSDYVVFGFTAANIYVHRVDGMSYQQIAQRHQLSISTVEKHIAKATLQITSSMEGW
jgi:hypothetical protein